MPVAAPVIIATLPLRAPLSPIAMAWSPRSLPSILGADR
jgi:hypothetical protein